VDINGTGTNTELNILAFEVFDYPIEIREAVFDLSSLESSSVDKISQMNIILGKFFADAALRLMKDNGVKVKDVDAIGSHGQTIHHLPILQDSYGYKVRSTLQIGEPAIIAERTGIAVVADFRKADIAAGGEGAPLTPYLDYILYRNQNRNLVHQNIGGIANLTYLPANASPEDVIAFDSGPGNMVIDGIMRKLTSKPFDNEGKLAEKGKIVNDLLEELLDHEYFTKEPPKTTGRETFGKSYSDELIKKSKNKELNLEDIIATATALTVESIARAYEQFLPKEVVIDEVYLSGGGAKNQHLVKSLKRRLSPIPVGLSDKLGIPGDAKEAILIAILCNEHLSGNPGNIPKATGARKPVVLGAYYPGS
jgi:anhydro-N-acetylmuramic acid kinase